MLEKERKWNSEYKPRSPWYDFTFDNPAYPKEFEEYLQKKPMKSIEEYAETLYSLMPVEKHWLVENIVRADELYNMDDDDFYWAIDATVYSDPVMEDFAATNRMLTSLMTDERVSSDLKCALWRAKVSLDLSIKIYREDFPDGM